MWFSLIKNAVRMFLNYKSRTKIFSCYSSSILKPQNSENTSPLMVSLDKVGGVSGHRLKQILFHNSTDTIILKIK